MSDNRYFSKTANYPYLDHLVASIKAELPLDGRLPPKWGARLTHCADIVPETIQTPGVGAGHEARIALILKRVVGATARPLSVHRTPHCIPVNQTSTATEVLEKLHVSFLKQERRCAMNLRELLESEEFIQAELSRRLNIDSLDFKVRLGSVDPMRLEVLTEVWPGPRLVPRNHGPQPAVVTGSYMTGGMGDTIDRLCARMESAYGLTDHFKSRPDEVTHDFVNRGVQPGDVLITSCGLKHTITADDLALHDTWSDTVQTLGGYSNILSNAIMSKTTWTSKKDPAPATDPYLKDPYGDLKGRLYSRLKLVVAEVNQMIAQVERLLLKQGLIRHDANPIDYPVWRAPSPERARTMSVEALEKELLAVSGEFTARTLQLRELEKTANSTKKGHR